MSAPRTTPPTEKVNINEAQSFKVWQHNPTYLEDAKPWKCLAEFYYLGDCLEYIARQQDMGHDSIFQSPADCRMIRATDRRTVYKG